MIAFSEYEKAKKKIEFWEAYFLLHFQTCLQAK